MSRVEVNKGKLIPVNITEELAKERVLEQDSSLVDYTLNVNVTLQQFPKTARNLDQALHELLIKEQEAEDKMKEAFRQVRLHLQGKLL